MSNFWLRLWHDMPNDPKWRTIARASKQPLALVQAAYIHILVDASRNVTRGHVTVTFEDLASALDCDVAQIEAIYEAMQGRVINGNELTGWDTRQPKREDTGNSKTGAKSAAQRKREQRERKLLAESTEDVTNVTNVTKNVTSHEMSRNGHDSVTGKRDINSVVSGENASASHVLQGCHAMSRNVTTDTDTDTDTDIRAGEARTQNTTAIAQVSGLQPVSIDERQKQAIDLDWQPDQKILHAICKKSGVDQSEITLDMVTSFKLWHSGKQTHASNHGWHTNLVRWAIRERSMSSERKQNSPNTESDPNDISWIYAAEGSL